MATLSNNPKDTYAGVRPSARVHPPREEVSRYAGKNSRGNLPSFSALHERRSIESLFNLYDPDAVFLAESAR